MRTALLLAAALLAACSTPGATPGPTPRSAAARAEFQRLTPCPATGARRGACPGWVVDHVEPLCAGGSDHWKNMQWQPAAESYVKDAAERRECRRR